MDEGARSPLCEELEAAFDWWREAGVDCDFSDEPANWLAGGEAQPEPPAQQPEERPAGPASRSAPAPRPAIAIDRASLPRDLEAFAAWWLTAPELDEGRTSGRVAPRGPRGAELMVVVPEPEREDRDTLLSGPQGKFLVNLVRAMGHDAARVYFASVLPRRLPGADWEALAAIGIGEVLRHHVALVGPGRLLAFGGNILPLLGNDLPQGSAVLREINLEGQSIPLLATRELAGLVDRPRSKAALWQALLRWTEPARKG